MKTKIDVEWQKLFNQLKVFSTNKLYKILGPFVIGIELIKLPRSEKYRPHFVVYPLWKDSLKESLDVPFILQEIYNKRKLQFSIAYENNYDLPEAVECIRTEVLINFDSDVSLKILFQMVDSRFNDILVRSNSAQQANLYELKFYAALYVNNNEQVQNALDQIRMASVNWNKVLFSRFFGNFDEWLSLLVYNAEHPDNFINQAISNKRALINKGLYFSELIP